MPYRENGLESLAASCIADASLRDEVLEASRPLLYAAQHVRYGLAAADQIDCGKIIALANETAEWQTSELQTVSAAVPSPCTVDISFLDRIQQLPRNAIDCQAIDSAQRDAFYEMIQRRLGKCLWKGAAQNSCRHLIRDRTSYPNVIQNLKYGGCEILFRCCCFAAAGDAARTRRYCRLLRNYIPSPIMGLLKSVDGRPQPLLVLVA